MKAPSLLLLAFCGALSHAQAGLASSFGCESVSGSVVFKDTVYGTLTGTVIAGLALLASDGGGSQSGQVLAGGAAVGGLLGLGLGITEVALRDCPHNLGAEKGFSSSLTAMAAPEGMWAPGLKVNWNF